MPELPEVETVVRELHAGGLVGRVISQAQVFWKPLIAPLTPNTFSSRLKGKRIRAISRRAKYIVLQLSGNDTILIHLRMTGQLSLARPSAPRDPHEHIVLSLDDGRDLRYKDTRKFGRWILTNRPDAILDRLGPEPLSNDFSPRLLIARLEGRRRQLKPLLLDQSFLAGIGNIYADEALWEARLHPKGDASKLTVAEISRLHAAIRHVLRRGIRTNGTTLGNGQSNFRRPGGKRGKHQEKLKIFRKTGQPCLRCGTPIRRLVIGQRATHICPKCQPEQG